MANSLRNRLLHAITEDDAACERDDAANDIAAVNLRGEEPWWDHLVTNFFRHDEMALFTDLRIDRGVFNVLLNAIEDLPLQTRGRRSFIHSHREQLLFLNVYMAFGTSVLALLVTPRIKSVCEVHRIARRVAFLNNRRLKDVFIVDREEGRVDARGVGYVID